MNIKPLHRDFKCPVRSSTAAGGYDIYMPEGGVLNPVADKGQLVGLGFAAEVPRGYVALLLPRSGAGTKFGLELNNTCGVIDADYRGEWMASLRVKDGHAFQWGPGDRILQFLLVPVGMVDLMVVNELDTTTRGEGGLGSTGV